MIFSRFKWKDSSYLELKEPIKAFIYYRSMRLNLLTVFPETYSFDFFLNRLQNITMQERFHRPTVFHFYYELGHILMGLGHAVDEDTPLAIEIEYQEKRIHSKPKTKIKNIPLKSLERPTWGEYKVAFSQIQEHLLAGNCYQVNLTFPYDFECQDLMDPRDICDFFFSRNQLSAYAHATFLGDEMILSNSPECLFQYSNNKITTMHIKGTMRTGKNWKDDWETMKKSIKEEGELNMITDLLRNDLNRLQFPIAEVLKKKAPLIVPGLLHQCSVISVSLKEALTFQKTLECLFPGGSVTGAPKKRVMEIILEIERYKRGIYCGSTLLCDEEKKIASINIRTAQLSVGDKLWRYGAGGGVTLLSRPVSEFQEMESKVYSFLTLLKVPGH
jgi:anthranilate/para-aminobenzoate synthase component I